MELEVSRATPSLPQPQAHEVLIVSKFPFWVVDSGTLEILRTAERNVDELQPGSLFFLVERIDSFPTRHIKGEYYDTYYRPRAPINTPVVGATIDLGTVDGLRRLEISASTWEYQPNLTLGHNVFLSDLDAEDAWKTVVYAEQFGETTLASLEEQGQWTIFRNARGLIAEPRF